MGSAGGGVIDFERLRFRFEAALSTRLPLGVLSMDWSASLSLLSSEDEEILQTGMHLDEVGFRTVDVLPSRYNLLLRPAR